MPLVRLRRRARVENRQNEEDVRKVQALDADKSAWRVSSAYATVNVDRRGSRPRRAKPVRAYDNMDVDGTPLRELE